MRKTKTENMINIMQIRAFCMVVERGTVSRASHDLFRTQSAITRSIRDLEHTLALSLFERHSNGMLLTDIGKCILPRAQRALVELNQIPALLNRLQQQDDRRREDTEPIWLFNVRRLQIFLHLYNLNHTQSVANTLGITQPAVSAALKVLGKGAGVALFQRTPKGMMPTPAGREIAANISRALNELRHIPEDIAARQGMLTGTVHVGALPLSRARLLPQALIKLISRHPGIKVVTNESAFSALITELRAGNIDFIIGALRKEEKLLEIQNEVLFEEELILLARPQHPLAGRQVLKQDLRKIQWVLPRETAPSRFLLEQALQRMGVEPPHPVVESGDPAVVRALLLGSDMVAAVSSHQLDYEVSAGILMPLRINLVATRREIGLTFRQGALLSPAAAALVRCVHEVIPGETI